MLVFGELNQWLLGPSQPGYLLGDKPYYYLLTIELCCLFEQGNTTGCPREPWHDLHSKIDGPAAYDVLTNFEERWRKASKPHGIKKLKSGDDALLRIERIPGIIGISDAPSVRENDAESWHVQVVCHWSLPGCKMSKGWGGATL